MHTISHLCCKAQNFVSAHFQALYINTNVNAMIEVIFWEAMVIKRPSQNIAKCCFYNATVTYDLWITKKEATEKGADEMNTFTLHTAEQSSVMC